MNNFKELYNSDIARYVDNKIPRWTKKFLYYFRKVSTCQNKLLKVYYIVRYNRVCNKHGIEIPRLTTIGKGLYVGHPYNITINSNAVLGKNINVHKGVTIGRENRGKRKGSPTIGNNVWIGINATIVGNITVGDDVLIAPGSYVNCDVPSHSVVVGNPCKITPKEDAVKDYVNNAVE